MAGIAVVRQAERTPQALGRATWLGRPPPRVRKARSTYWSTPLVLSCAGLATMGLPMVTLATYSLSDWIFVAAACAAIMTLLSRRSKGLNPPQARRAPAAFVATSLFLLTWGTLSTFWSLDPFGSILVVVRLGWLLLGWIWLLRAVAVDRRALFALLTAFKVSVLANAILAIGQSLGFIGYSVGDPAAFGDRMTAFFPHPNHLGAFLTVGSLLFLLEVRPEGPDVRRPVWKRAAHYAGLICVLYALTTTGSMTGVTGTLIAVVVVLGVRSITHRQQSSGSAGQLGPVKAMMFILVLCIVVMRLMSSDNVVVTRFTDLIQGEKHTVGSVEARTDFTSFVLDRFDELLVVGVGLDPTSTHEAEFGLTGANHNMPLKLMYQAGLPALAALVVLVAVTFMMVWRLILSTVGIELQPFALMLLGGLVGINVMAQAQPMTYDRSYWLVTAFVSALWALRRAELEPRPALRNGFGRATASRRLRTAPGDEAVQDGGGLLGVVDRDDEDPPVGEVDP